MPEQYETCAVTMNFSQLQKFAVDILILAPNFLPKEKVCLFVESYGNPNETFVKVNSPDLTEVHIETRVEDCFIKSAKEWAEESSKAAAQRIAEEMASSFHYANNPTYREQLPVELL